jgi:hypothetical protein
MAEVTFRDFAGAAMSGDRERGAQVLQELLGLSSEAAGAATDHFRAQMAADQSFMMKAMGLRTAVTSGSDAEIATLLRDCFGLAPPADASAVAKLRERYPRP